MILCKLGIHRTSRKVDIPEELKSYYSQGKTFNSCDCGELDLVEFPGNHTQKRVRRSEQLWVELQQEAARKAAEVEENGKFLEKELGLNSSSPKPAPKPEKPKRTRKPRTSKK